MGKITQEQKNKYFEMVKQYRNTIEAGLAAEKTILELLGKDDTGAGYKRLHLAEVVLDLSSWYVLVNGLSVVLLGIKNEDYLLEGRKTLVRALKYLEDTVSATLDGPFSDYEARLVEIKDFDAASRFKLMRKFGFAIQSFEEAFGENSKYSWSFMELWSKFAALAKNTIDLKTVIIDLDFNSPLRPTISAHIALVKSLFQRCADKYREQYELYTHKHQDFKQAIVFLSADRHFRMILGEREEAESLKKKIDVWKSKLEADSKRQEEKQSRNTAADPN